MKTISLWLSLVIIFCAGCSSPVYVQKDDSISLSQYKTYMWENTRHSEEDNSTRAAEFADISVRNSVNAELRKLGWQEVTENPDALLSYDILVERSIEQKSDPVYTQPFSRMYYNPRLGRWSRIYYPSQFMGYQTYEVPVKEGTITISIVDAKSDKAIWQGWTTENMNYARFTSDEIARGVKNIFKKFESS